MMNGKQKYDLYHIENEDVIDIKKSRLYDDAQSITTPVPSEETKMKCSTDELSVVVPSDEKENISFALPSDEKVLKVYPKRSRLPSAKAIAVLNASTSKINSKLASTGTSSSKTKSISKVVSKRSEKRSTEPAVEIFEQNVKPLQSCADTELNAENDTEVIADVPADAPSMESTPKQKQIVKTKKTSTSKLTKNATNNEEGKRKRCMPKTVDKRLQQMGIIPSRVSSCVKAAMSKGYIKLTGDPSDLEQFIIEGDHYDHQYKVLLKDVLYQADYGGDYEDGSEMASARCSCCPEDDYPGKAYVTRLCSGNPELDSGKFHNHCTDCKKGFGVCIGDYRMAHCNKCNKHWFTGLSGFPCDNCERMKDRSGGFGRLFMNMGGSDSDEEDRHQGTCTLS